MSNAPVTPVSLRMMRPKHCGLLAADARIALVVSAATNGGAAFIRATRRRCPELPLAVMIACPSELAALVGTPECPVLVLSTPIRASQVEEVLRLALRQELHRSGGPRSLPG